MTQEQAIAAIRARHAVRSYTSKPIEQEKINQLQLLIDEYNNTARLHMQLVTGEPNAFAGFMAHYGKFSGVENYIALVGSNDGKLDEKLGYYGEKLVLEAQLLGLNTCWVGLTFSKTKNAFTIASGEKLVGVIALGYGTTQGVAHKVKSPDKVASLAQPGNQALPEWFTRGIAAALLAPTAMNQQKFRFTLQADGSVKAKAGLGFFTKVDLGIVKCHFELAAGRPIKWV